MKVTAQEEYGLRCLLQLAREPSGSKTIPEIAAAESLSEAYVAKLMRVLRKAGYVNSLRGQKGGYRLARPPDQIEVGAVLETLGGRLYSKEFCGRHAGHETVCVHNTDCSVRALFMALEGAIERSLSQTRLNHLLCGEQQTDWVKTAQLSRRPED